MNIQKKSPTMRKGGSSNHKYFSAPDKENSTTTVMDRYCNQRDRLR